jgi:hypothetical protein
MEQISILFLTLGGFALQISIASGQWKGMEAPLDARADINLGAHEFGTPLQQAIERGSKVMAMELLRCGEDVNLNAGRYGTALTRAVFKGDEEMFHELPDGAADINSSHGYHGKILQAVINRRHGP